MGELITAPIDELTGLPLPILMQSHDFRPIKGREAPATPNYHHHFHPRNSIELGLDGEEGKKLAYDDPLRLEGLAVRYSRGQYTPKWLHNRYHKIFLGPELPDNSHDKFTAVVLACAGVVPRRAIDLYSPGEYSEVSLSDNQHDFIAKKLYYEGAASKPGYPNRKGEIGRFIATYAIENSLNEILSENEIWKKVEEFLEPKDQETRSKAGKFILAHAVDASVADLIPIHKTATKERMIRKSPRQLGNTMLRYFTQDRFPDYFVPLEDRLNLVLGV
jgi:hypothetical protein